MKQVYSDNDYSWVENFPKEFHSLVLSHAKEAARSDNQKPQHSERYKKLYEDNTPPRQRRIAKPNQNAHLITANRVYNSGFQTTDRRNTNIAADFPMTKCRRKRRHDEEIKISGLSTLRENYENDALEKRKRLFNRNNTITPIQIEGLEYSVLIGDDFMIIGCIERSIDEWKNIDDRTILEMDGKDGLTFWANNKDMLLNACAHHQRRVNSAKSAK